MAAEKQFRTRTKNELVRLLAYWRVIERGIKRAEQINGEAVIPAINELRYASRQLLNIQVVFDNAALTKGQMSAIQKRLIIADQYLLNADHDTIDGSLSFYRKIIKRLNDEFGAPEITKHYHSYPAICDLVVDCEALVEETRYDYEKRKVNYDKIRDNHLETLVKAYRKFENAEIDALYDKASLQRQLDIKNRSLRIYKGISLIGAIASIISIPLAFWLAFTSGFHFNVTMDLGLTPPPP